MPSLRILIASGDEAIREVLGATLRAADCEVSTVAITDEAISQATQFAPDTLVIDTIMPGKVDGLRAAKRISEETKCRVLFLESMHDLSSDYSNALRREIPDCDVLPVPFENDEATAIVHRRETGWSVAERRRSDAEVKSTVSEAKQNEPKLVPSSPEPYLLPDHRANEPSYPSEEWVGGVLGVLFVLLVGYIALVFYAPHQKFAENEQNALKEAKIAVATVLQKRLIGGKEAEGKNEAGSGRCEGLPMSCVELDKALDDILGPLPKTFERKSKPQPDTVLISLDCPPEISREGNYQYVQMPDGTLRRFSASASVAQIMRAIAKDFPSCMYNPATGKLESAPAKEGDIIIDLDAVRDSATTRKNSAADKENLSPTSTVLRLEPRGGNNLYIYLRKSDFDTVLYPDRKEFLTAVGKAWCDNTGEDSHWLLPSVYIGDIRTGEELASYSCVFDSVAW